MFASKHGHEGVVRALLEVGPAVDSKNTNGVTALMYAGEEGVVRVLLVVREWRAFGHSTYSVAKVATSVNQACLIQGG